MEEPAGELQSEPELKPVSEVTKNTSNLSMSSSSEKVKVQGDGAKQRTGRAEIFKYHGCSWPGVVGLKAHKAKRIIGKGKPDLYCVVHPETQLQTRSYSSRRVRLVVDKNNNVVQIPRVG